MVLLDGQKLDYNDELLHNTAIALKQLFKYCTGIPSKVCSTYCM